MEEITLTVGVERDSTLVVSPDYARLISREPQLPHQRDDPKRPKPTQGIKNISYEKRVNQKGKGEGVKN